MRKKGRLRRLLSFAGACVMLIGSILPETETAEAAATSFISIDKISFFSHSSSFSGGAGSWEMEIFFEKDSSFSASKNWSDLTDDQKTNKEIAYHQIVYCVEGLAKNPSGVSPDSTTTLSGSGLSKTQKEALQNVLKNGYPANKDYWYSNGVTSYYKQAAATQLAIWCVSASTNPTKWTEGFEIGNYTSSDASLYAMAKKLYDCGMDTSLDVIKPSVEVEAVGSKKYPDKNEFQYKWKVTPSNCSWGTRLSFDTVPSGSVAWIDNETVTLNRQNAVATDNNSGSYYVYLDVPAGGNSEKKITLEAIPYEPDPDPTKIVYYKLTKISSDNRKYQDMIRGSITAKAWTDPVEKSLTSPAYGDWISVTKKGTDGTLLAGAVFGIYTDKACTKPATVYNERTLETVKAGGYKITTGTNGVAESYYLREGTYYVKELEPPTGYASSGEVKSVEIQTGTTAYLEYKNSPKGGWISVTKKDMEGNTLGEGAVFGIYTDFACTKPATVYEDKALTKVQTDPGYKITTDANGVAKSWYLADGTYYVKELVAPPGYALSGDVKKARVPLATTVYFEFRNPRKGGWISVTKKDTEGKTLGAGAVFGIYTDSDCKTPATVYEDKGRTVERPDGYRITTDANGVAESWYLNEGTYYVKELVAPPGYALSDDVQSAHVPYATTVYFTFENNPIRYAFKKTDESGNALSGCEFGLYDENGTEIDHWVTDDTGIHEVTGILTVGQTYTLKELSVPDSYATASDRTFTVTDTEDIVTVETVNRKQHYPVSVTIVKDDGQGQPVAGVTVALFCNSGTGDAITFMDRTWYLYGTKTTGPDGKAVWEGLEAEKEWILAEMSTVSGLTLLSEPVYLGTLPWETDKAPDASYAGTYREANGIFYLYDITADIANHSTFEMPFTGGAGFRSVSVLTAAGLLLAAALSSKKGKKEHETERND